MQFEENSLVDTGGQVTFISALFLNMFQYFTVVNVNTLLTMLVSVAGLIYMSLKIYSQILDLKAKRKKKRDGGKKGKV